MDEKTKIEQALEAWKTERLDPLLEKHPERKETFKTTSGKPVDRLVTPTDVAPFDYLKELGFPGQYPYTRGIHPTMYRGRLWTMRQFSGFGTPEETNERYHYLIEHGQTGLSVAFDLPTLMGRDSDDPMSAGEVGKCGVAIDTLADMETLFDAIDLGQISTSMTINSPAAILLAMYLAVAEKQGVPFDQVRGTLQNDILKEYIAQKEYIFPPRPSMKLVADTISFCTEHVPLYNTISISGYHIREAGSTAVQELAFTIRDGIEYVEWALNAGLEVDTFAPRLSFFFNAHNDLFEEVAKYRAARKLWATIMKERFHAKSERSLWLRFHTQTAGCSLTAQQPHNNIVRTAVQALAAILGGTQSLHTNALDETLALPTQRAATIALRTQQILAHESGVANTIDPLAGSYYLEDLTRQMEVEALEYIRTIDDMGGMVAAIEQGYPQREVQESAYQYQKAIDAHEAIIVGVNAHESEDNGPIEILEIDERTEQKQREKLQRVRRERSDAEFQRALTDLRNTARQDGNVMPALLDCVRAYASVGEIVGVFKDVYGEYEEPAII